MLIKEYRITMPLTVEEYQIGQLFSVAEASKAETGGGEGVQVLRNEPFHDQSLLGGKFTHGQYTYKIYYLASRIPAIIRRFMPQGSTEIHEEAWNAYPYCKTIITNPGWMRDGFSVCIETMHYPDNGKQENIHELPQAKLSQREVVYLDIATSPVSGKDYKAREDPTVFRSEKTGRGPLIGPNWKNEVQPVMTCYKLVTCEFKMFGLQTRIENYIQNTEKRIFLNFHRQLFCWIDRWHGLTIKDIREIEEQTKRELMELRNKGQIRGMHLED